MSPGRWLDPALRSFYAEDARRERSAEVDVGLRWRSRDGATFRAAWIVDTGELYAIRHGEPGERRRVMVLARLGATALWRRLEGWHEVSERGAPGSFEWFRARATTPNPSPA